MPSQTREDSDAEMQDAESTSGGQNSAMPLPQESTEQDDKYARYERSTQRITVLPGDTPTAASFQFTNEGHTLGNALRYIIMKNPSVEFCGYSIPHPSDPLMNLRIQTYDNVSVYDVLEKGLDDLMEVCDVVTKKFKIARAQYEPPNK